MLGGVLFMAAIAVENAVVSLYADPKHPNTSTSKTIDHSFMISLACAYVVFHLIFITYITVNVSILGVLSDMHDLNHSIVFCLLLVTKFISLLF